MGVSSMKWNKNNLCILIAAVVLLGSAEASASKAVNRDDAECIDTAAKKLGLNKFSHTDPKLLNEILEEDMFLADLESVRVALDDKLTKRYPLKPMISRVLNSIVEKHPPTVEFICEALNRDLIPKLGKKERKTLERIVHHTFLLEYITQAMADNWRLMVEIRHHLIAKREAFGIRSDFMGSVLDLYALTGELFEPIKTKTMDWVFSEYERIREAGTISDQEIAARQNSLKFNILEAAITENHNGYHDNAMAGIALTINPFSTVRVDEEDRFLEYEQSQEWNSLYESWNLAFITANMPHFGMLYPKLLIPSVIDADPDDYLFNRALSLWVSLNFHLFAQLNQKPDFEIPNREELSLLWSEINHKYGKELVLANQGVALENFGYLLGMTYETLWGQLKMLLIGSGVITPDEAQQLTELLGQN